MGTAQTVSYKKCPTRTSAAGWAWAASLRWRRCSTETTDRTLSTQKSQSTQTVARLRPVVSRYAPLRVFSARFAGSAFIVVIAIAAW